MTIEGHQWDAKRHTTDPEHGSPVREALGLNRVRVWHSRFAAVGSERGAHSPSSRVGRKAHRAICGQSGPKARPGTSLFGARYGVCRVGDTKR
jgi:hypothetical protein